MVITNYKAVKNLVMATYFLVLRQSKQIDNFNKIQ